MTKKFSEFNEAGPLTGTEIIPGVQSGEDVQITSGDLSNFVGSTLSVTYVPGATPFTLATMPNTWTSGDLQVIVPTDDSVAIAMASPGDDFPRILVLPSGGIYIGDGTSDPVSDGVSIGLAGDSLSIYSGSGGRVLVRNVELTHSAESQVDLLFGFGAGPVIVDQTDGHTYRITSTNGVLSTTQVS